MAPNAGSIPAARSKTFPRLDPRVLLASIKVQSQNALAVDSADNAYVTGPTNSTAVLTTVHALAAPNNALQGNSDAFISKLSFDGSTLSLLPNSSGRAGELRGALASQWIRPATPT